MLKASRIDEVERRVVSLVGALASRHGCTTNFRLGDSLLDGGMTSVAMVELMLSVESDFHLIVPDADLTPANFQSINSLTRLVSRLRGICGEHKLGPGAEAEVV